MNRLVLIGNGFDIAHGLQTSYKSFISWYFNQWGHRLLNSIKREESDGLCTFRLNDGINAPNWASVFQGYYFKRENPFVSWNDSDAFIEAYKDKNLCKITFNSPLLQRIWTQLLLGWVDIENEYYSLLFQEKMDLKEGFIYPNYKAINDQLNILRNKLIQYLKEIEKKEIHAIDDIEEKIYRPIKKRELAVAYRLSAVERSKEELNPARVMLLNFNYTKTPSLYTLKHSHVSINNIHGCLDKPDSVIFGYGDELDDGFKKLKDKNNNECLRHMKSIRYLESNNYRKMLEFIESAPFQVCIMGHSCGNSDRTLLNTLFEHRNCVSVKPYFYINEKNEDNYLELVQNISRNFTDMKLYRDRVVNEEYCELLVSNK
ncbi:Bacteriophage abortive infection AbiH [Prevotella sp. ne3005]|uniref:AbiH family protein n=1 Tax=Prevotella sp. ne3005 TaxID=1761887 RepID=UPI0008D16E40|nr:AbiH family protein [Prevotella sp. ne3005]SEN12868.1 Bacteriophage abortive infection AbiH [Prevotella sp. ne3005]